MKHDNKHPVSRAQIRRRRAQEKFLAQIRKRQKRLEELANKRDECQP